MRQIDWIRSLNDDQLIKYIASVGYKAMKLGRKRTLGTDSYGFFELAKKRLLAEHELSIEDKANLLDELEEGDDIG